MGYQENVDDQECMGHQENVDDQECVGHQEIVKHQRNVGHQEKASKQESLQESHPEQLVKIRQMLHLLRIQPRKAQRSPPINHCLYRPGEKI